MKKLVGKVGLFTGTSKGVKAAIGKKSSSGKMLEYSHRRSAQQDCKRK